MLIRLSPDDLITKVKVATGDRLGNLDTTKTLTHKYQAQCIPRGAVSELITPVDTQLLSPLVAGTQNFRPRTIPVSHPASGELLPIATLYVCLKHLIGTTISDFGYDQERNRGAALNRAVCAALGYTTYQDDGQFPDVRHQLLEVKLQTSPTIDLGLVLPSSMQPLDVPKIANRQVRHCDVRYAVFFARTDRALVTLTHLFLTTGEGFFSRFAQFQGMVLNKKLQITLPSDFFA